MFATIILFELIHYYYSYRFIYLFISGFGRSSRPTFSTDAVEAEKQMVSSVEEWRKEMKLNELIVLGHSLGGFVATSYAIHYPERYVAKIKTADFLISFRS